MKVPNFTFCGGPEHKTTAFFFFSCTSIKYFRIKLQKKIANIWRIEGVGISATSLFKWRFGSRRRGCCLSSLLIPKGGGDHDKTWRAHQSLSYPNPPFSHLGENLSPVEGSPAYPNNPWRPKVSKNLSNILYEKQTVGSSRRVTLFRWSGHLPAGPSPYKHFGSPSRVNSVKTRQDFKKLSRRGTLLSRTSLPNKNEALVTLHVTSKIWYFAVTFVLETNEKLYHYFSCNKEKGPRREKAGPVMTPCTKWCSEVR